MEHYGKAKDAESVLSVKLTQGERNDSIRWAKRRRGMSPNKRPRVLIADDHTFVAEACAKILEPEFEVVGIVADGQSLLATVPELKPDIIVLDVGMPLLNGLEAGRRIKSLVRPVKIVYLTMNNDVGIAAEAFRFGASGYLLKTSATAELVTAVREVLKGKLYVSPLITRDPDTFFLEIRVSHIGQEKLTNRQREVLQLLAEGRSMKEVAYILKLTPRTVAFHKYKIMAVLRITTNADLVQYAIREHVISPRV
jgi:DNA-binding NarL/FixJ family response regulator